MTDLLNRYWQKRDFEATPEPRGKVSRSGKALSFVVQKHAARSLHYDFRLELDGTLKSWAVPKGPSLDPNDKRMAVHVEDHPLSYGSFEGVIPPGQYGAGTVIVWDRGTWEPVGDPREGYRQGKLKFELHGDKLQGGWALVRMHGRRDERQEPWLLIKERDEHARPAAQYNVVDERPDSVLGQAQAARPAKRSSSRGAARKTGGAVELPAGAKPAELPLAFAPQLATLVDRAPPGDDWIYEIKFDGYRLLARLDGDDVRLFTRNGNDWTARLKSLAAAVKAIGLPSGWYDGEIVVPGKDGAPDFNALQNAFDSSRTENIRYYLFDVPYCDGHDLREVPLVQRRAVLARLMQATHDDRIRYSEDFVAKPDEILQNACRMRLEGVIGKRRDSLYVSRRSPQWIKLKCTHRQEFVVVGYTDPEGSRVGIGSLLLAIHDQDGKLRYAGKVGSGFDTRTLAALEKKLKALAVATSPLAEKVREARGHWVQPRLVAEVSFSEWTPDGRIRHSIFHGLRDDKPASVITKETPAPAKAVAGSSPRTSAGKKSTREPPDDLPPLPKDLRITHPERVIDQSTGLTKQDLVNHYLRVARRMLPHLQKRPVALVRAPSGIGAQLFFQKHAETLKIPELKRLDPALDPGHPPLIEIDSFTALIGAAQMNVVEFHTWNAKTSAIEKPDRMTFDLDPGEGVEWSAMQEAAVLMRTLLDEIGLKAFLKTSGGKGLHVVVPLAPREDWDTVKDFSQAVVQHLAATVPSRFVAKSGAKNRVGRIFVDYLRNGRGATTACAFSARARPGLGVSIPVAWDELPDLTSGAHWTIVNAHERLDTGDDPWADYAKTRQTLTKAMKAIGFQK
ncbi:DNA ligase D [Piscinibacter sp. XHJ-5]|uniref:DNA ligase D n=1 Tax=Piscinibacter sp. XHJ-5 TaxID=3037797 RepID=UPI002452E8B9|nr:DNA ligase D [Piscinibacter sp. XHJ-5]